MNDTRPLRAVNNRLARLCVITAGQQPDAHWLGQRIHKLYAAGMRMLVMREPNLSCIAHEQLLYRVSRELPELLVIEHWKCPAVQTFASRNIVDPSRFFHLPAAFPRAFKGVAKRHRFGVSCHDAAEISRAAQAGARYVTLSPIWSPTSKPDDRRPPLGVDRYFDQLCDDGLPVFALGGVSASRLSEIAHPHLHIAAIGHMFGMDEDRAVQEFTTLDAALRSTLCAFHPSPS